MLTTIKIILFGSLVLISCCAALEARAGLIIKAEDFPNCDQLGMVYDYVGGTPFASLSLVDHGLMYFPLINVVDDKGVLYPWVHAYHQKECAYEVTTKEVYTFEEQKEINTEDSGGKAGLSIGKVFSISGGTSKEETEEKNTLREGLNTYVYGWATCLSYVVTLSDLLPREALSDEFVQIITSLPDKYEADPEAYQRAYSILGSAYIKGFSGGARAVAQYQFQSHRYEQLKKTNVKTDDGAKASLFGFYVDMNQNNNKQTENTKKFREALTKETYFGVGAQPPVQNDSKSFGAWAETTDKSPAAILKVLGPITDFFTPKFFPNVTTIAQKRAGYIQAVRQACIDAPGCSTEPEQPMWPMVGGSGNARQGHSFPPASCMYRYFRSFGPSTAVIGTGNLLHIVQSNTIETVDVMLGDSTKSYGGNTTAKTKNVVAVQPDGSLLVGHNDSVCSYQNLVQVWCSASYGGSIRKIISGLSNEVAYVVLSTQILAINCSNNGVSVWNKPISVNGTGNVVLGHTGLLYYYESGSSTYFARDISVPDVAEPSSIVWAWKDTNVNQTDLIMVAGNLVFVRGFIISSSVYAVLFLDAMTGSFRVLTPGIDVLTVSQTNIAYVLQADRKVINWVFATTGVLLGATKSANAFVSCSVGADNALFCTGQDRLYGIYAPNKAADWSYPIPTGFLGSNILIGQGTLVLNLEFATSSQFYGFNSYGNPC